MTEDQKEICNELMFHANTKKEAKIAMLELFPSIDKNVLIDYIFIKWKAKLPKGKISFKHKDYVERFRKLSGLFYIKEKGDIRKITAHISKGLSKHTPYDLYKVLVGNDIHIEGRELLRGEKVELIQFSPDKRKIIVRKSESSFECYVFSIWDINANFYIETE
jgi:hypothetical protein